jgi:hypothetical protein
MAKIIKDIGSIQKEVDPELVAQALGAKEVGVAIDTAQAPISLFSLRQFIVERIRSSGGRPTLVGGGKKRNKIVFLANDWEKLKKLAKYYKDKENINATPGQIASILIHMALTRIKK